MDNIDLKILDILQADGRITMKELGQRVGLTSPATIERVKKLEEGGVIAGYKAILNIPRAGLPVRAFLLATLQNQQTGDKFVEFIRQQDGVLNCHRLAGRAAYLVEAVLSDMAGLEHFLDQVGVYGTLETYLVLSSPVEHKAVVLP
ncbi:MAG TPA: Lrp/AsnC family transcriptional regulator [Selenomonadales bacterium]|nr:Lrp/AsnC family transcriptional regulator [Selenomonadales bacterium]